MMDHSEIINFLGENHQDYLQLNLKQTRRIKLKNFVRALNTSR